MIRRIEPGTAHGTVRVPASKSMSHRCLIAAALAHGKSVITGISLSKDIEATVGCLQALGIRCEIYSDSVTVYGGALSLPSAPLFCCESGSTLRFLIPLASLFSAPVSFTGEGKLLSRPQSVYEELFGDKGLSFVRTEHAITVCGKLTGGTFSVKGDVSSQFITGLLFALPLLQEDSCLVIEPPYESKSYVDMTVSALRCFGIMVDDEDPLKLRIPGNQKYKPADISVEGDYSQSAFFAALGALSGDVVCRGLPESTCQGDKIFNSFLTEMGGNITREKDSLCSKKSVLNGGNFSIEDCPDIGPILMVCAAFAASPSKITGIRRLRMKESDRVNAMEQELSRLGAEITCTENEMIVIPHAPYRGGCTFMGHNDHRIVMSMAVASSACREPSVIVGTEAVEKSYPNFFEDLAAADIRSKVLEEKGND